MAPVDPRKRVAIHYCPKCRWLARAAWVAQELLATFDSELSEVALVPSEVAGRFDVHVGEVVVFSRKAEGGFLQPKDLKQRVRDAVAPQRDLGHADKPRD